MAGQPLVVSWREVYMPTSPALSAVWICHPAALTIGVVLTAAVDALPFHAVGDITAAVFEALPAPAERGVTNAATDVRIMVATMRVMMNRLTLSMSCITFSDAL